MNAVRALLKKDARALRNMPRILRGQSRFKAVFVAAFGAALLLGLGRLFLDGFRFVGALGGLGVMLVRHLFALFFFGLSLMLVLSSLVVTCTTLLHSEELPFLWARPMPRGGLLLHLWAETTGLSSWALFFVIGPFIGAFACYEQLPPWVVVWTLVFSAPFVFLCAGIGVLLALVLCRWLPRWRGWLWMLAALGFGAGVWAVSWVRGHPAQEDETLFVLARLVPGLKLASFPLWPSLWVAEGIMALARGQWARGGLFLGELAAHVLAIGLVIEWAGERLLYPAWLRLRDAPPRRRRGRPAAPGSRWLAGLAPDTRAIVLKDARCLLRDPAQWLQGILFFGLLAFYFVNLRALKYHLLSAVWRNLIVFLNMFSLSAVMCSFCSRFVYPQLSLEGQSFWLVGLAPTSMPRVLRAKFLAAVSVMLALSVGLMAVSVTLLDVGLRLRVTALALAAAMAVALCGLATGLGAVFLDLRQRNPVAILSGFGGTLNLALSLLYMGAAILPFGMLNHAFLSGRLGAAGLARGTAAAGAWLLLITLAAAWAPLALGRRSLARRDY